MAGAALWAGQTTILSRVTGEQERQRVFGLSFAILNLGIGLGGVAAGFIADVHRPASFELLYRVNALAYLIPAADPVVDAGPSAGRWRSSTKAPVRPVAIARCSPIARSVASSCSGW